MPITYFFNLTAVNTMYYIINPNVISFLTHVLLRNTKFIQNVIQFNKSPLKLFKLFKGLNFSLFSNNIIFQLDSPFIGEMFMKINKKTDFIFKHLNYLYFIGT